MMKILSYNLAQGKHPLADLNRAIQKEQPDVICFQEFTPACYIKLKLSGYLYLTAIQNEGFFRNIIFTRKPAIAIKTFKMTGESRQTIGCQIQTGGKSCWIIDVHLSSGREQTAQRKKQMTQLMAQCRKMSPAIIVGDFNLAKDETSWKNQSHGSWNVGPLLPTYCSTNPCVKSCFTFNHPFDRAMYRGVTLSKQRVLKLKSSDHYGLLITVKL